MAEVELSCGPVPRPADECSGRSRRLTIVVGTVLLMIMMTSCSTLGPDTAAADGVATAFYRAVHDGDGIGACTLLAPATVEELERTSGQPCPEAILDQDLPDVKDVLDSQAFGRGAQVVMTGDVVFLSMFDDHWSVTGVGCTSRGDRPYDCIVKGG